MTTEERIEHTRAQLGRVERALESLRREVEHANPARFELMAESYIDMIAELRAELVRLVAEANSGGVTGIQPPLTFDPGRSPAS
jgi:hypothetical protein